MFGDMAKRKCILPQTLCLCKNIFPVAICHQHKCYEPTASSFHYTHLHSYASSAIAVAERRGENSIIGACIFRHEIAVGEVCIQNRGPWWQHGGSDRQGRYRGHIF